MKPILRNRLLGLAITPAIVMLAGCGIDVQEQEDGDRKRVEIHSAVGDMTVNTNVDAPATGLPVYPGARPLHDGDEPRSANVSIGSSLFDLKVAAAKFESDEAPQQIVDYYRQEMAAYGAVMECRGDVDFKGRGGERRPVCRERGSREIQLVAGTEERHRLVSVKPRRDGSEFAVVYIETRADDGALGAPAAGHGGSSRTRPARITNGSRSRTRATPSPSLVANSSL